MLHDLYQWTIAWAQTPDAELALFLLAIAESSFFPLPPDILMIAMGVADPRRALFFALLTSVGSILGGVIGYGIGRWGGRPLLKKIVSEKNLAAAEHLYQKYDLWAVAIAGFTPLPYKVFTLSAGALQVRFRNFLLASALSRPARFFLVGGALSLWGGAIQGWLDRYFNLATILFVILLAGGFLALRWLRPKRGNRKVSLRS